jgi:hypothetical protein
MRRLLLNLAFYVSNAFVGWCQSDRLGLALQSGHCLRGEPRRRCHSGVVLLASFLIVSSLDLNPRLQTGRGFSRFLFIG